MAPVKAAGSPLSFGQERGQAQRGGGVRAFLSTRHSALGTYPITDTAVPIGAQAYRYAATSSGRLMQPWLIGVPKLLCQ